MRLTVTFELLVRYYRRYEAFALYEAYYERMANLGSEYAHLGDSLPIAWVPLVFHCTHFKSLKRILRDGFIRPRHGKSYVSLTELSMTELTRFRSLRPDPFEVALGIPRSVLESRGLFQPAYLKHVDPAVKERFKDLPLGYVELEDDLGALHEVRFPSPIPVDDVVWMLSSRRNEETKALDLPELIQVKKLGISVSFWHPSHQQGIINEPAFRKVTKEGDKIKFIECCGKHYLHSVRKSHKAKIVPPAGRSFEIEFPLEIRPDTLTDEWEGPFSKYEMAVFFYKEIEKNFPERVNEVRPRIKVT